MPSKFLNISVDNTLGGASPSDETVSSQKAIKEYVDSHGAGVDIDEKSITKNTDNELQTVGVIDQNNPSTPLKQWSGTKAEYQALVSGGTVDSDTIYNITDDETITDFANISLNNLDATGKKVIDGQWVDLPSGNVAQGFSVNGSTNAEFDISSFLPNDGYSYEVLISVGSETGTTSGDHVPVYIYSDYFTGSARYICFCRARTRTSSSVYGGGAVAIPVGTERKIYLIRSTNYKGTTSIDIRGYRRIGTNS